MLEAFSYGAPPHGGLAHGVERLLMTITGEQWLREVVAFPQTSGGRTSVMEAPSEVDAKQLDALGIMVEAPVTVGKEGGSQAVYEAIVASFEKANVQFDPYEHPPVFTSEEAAKVRNTPIGEGAKALLLYADDHPIMVTLPGDRKLDMKSFKHLFEIKDLRMATPEEVKEVTGVGIGAVPPFGHIFGIPLYMDNALAAKESLSFNAGMHTRSIRVAAKEYEKVAKPIVGDFSKNANGQ
jgi:prolyl-tRNA editing enzyme YbaK/EbsC (Cys-tRNA(Pro) deacylase)